MQIDKQDGVTMIFCPHASALNATVAKTSDKPVDPEIGLAPARHGIEMSPGVLLMCCTFCAVQLRENILKEMRHDGCEVTVRMAPIPKAIPNGSFI